MRLPLSRRLPARLVAAAASVAVVLGACAGTDDGVDGSHLGAAAAGVFATGWEEITAPPIVLELEPVADAPVSLPDLPVPGPIPLDAHQPEPEITIGTLSIPKLGITEELHQGMSLTAINRGPSHWPGTAAPGQLGNMVIGGHRTTYSQPFYDLDLIEPGDEMIVHDDAGTHVYRAVSTEIVEPDALWIADQDHAFTATTFTCHPKGSARQRMVVSWQLVDDGGDPVPDPA